jgi:hypothetical protein
MGSVNNQIPKNTVTAPKTYRKISRLADYSNGLDRITEGVMPIDKAIGETNIGFDKICEQKLGSLAKTTTGIGSDWIPDHKKTSSHLLSQIHFCRFLYKIIERM